MATAAKAATITATTITSTSVNPGLRGFILIPFKIAAK